LQCVDVGAGHDGHAKQLAELIEQPCVGGDADDEESSGDLAGRSGTLYDGPDGAEQADPLNFLADILVALGRLLADLSPEDVVNHDVVVREAVEQCGDTEEANGTHVLELGFAEMCAVKLLRPEPGGDS
jgi:hypothetical protein